MSLLNSPDKTCKHVLLVVESTASKYSLGVWKSEHVDFCPYMDQSKEILRVIQCSLFFIGKTERNLIDTHVYV